ncbi:DUF6238 family protein [Streptomyces sp. NPDC004959]|uniref:DUF6238 family protein n=1 Tax=unclassified Streptomyces TaxID=2593676 RepID=UPI0004C9688B|nr:DUF6238 family protein [Streptomyces sp. NRRL F-5630]
MHQPEPPPPDGLLPLAATALDLHRATCTGPFLAGPDDLDALHDLGCALLRLLDVHAERATPIREAAAPLREARLRAWQLTDLLHRAAHAAPGPRPAPTHLCRRHHGAVRLIRRRATAAELRT